MDDAREVRSGQRPEGRWGRELAKAAADIYKREHKVPGVLPHPRFQLRQKLRERFFAKLETDEQRILWDLEGTCDYDYFWLMQYVREGTLVFENDWPWVPWCELADPPPDAHQLVLHLNRGLKAWSERWHLTDRWCLERAVATLAAWERHADGAARGSRQGTLHWAETLWSPPMPAQPECYRQHAIFSYTLPGGWSFQALSKDQLAVMILKDLADQVEGFLDQAEEEAFELDLLAPAASEVSDDHLAWLVMYQIGGLDWTDIAERVGEGKEPTTIRRPVFKAAKAMGLSLRAPTGHERSRQQRRRLPGKGRPHTVRVRPRDRRTV